MALKRSFLSRNIYSSKSPLEESSSKDQENKDMFKCMVFKPSHMESTFLRDFRPYNNIKRGFIKEFFIKVHDRMFLRIVKLFYTNIKFEYLTLTKLVKGVEVCIHMDNFGKIFEFIDFSKSYTYDEPSRLNKLSQIVVISILLVDPMGDKPLSIKTKFMKAKCCVVHHLLTCILFTR